MNLNRTEKEVNTELIPNNQLKFGKCTSCQHTSIEILVQDGRCLACIDQENIEQSANELDDILFEPCINCDLPDACEDFGCAIKQGLKNYNEF